MAATQWLDVPVMGMSAPQTSPSLKEDPSVMYHPIRMVTALTLIVAVTGALTACLTDELESTTKGESKPAVFQSDPTALMPMEPTLTDDRPITPMETVGAPGNV